MSKVSRKTTFKSVDSYLSSTSIENRKLFPLFMSYFWDSLINWLSWIFSKPKVELIVPWSLIQLQRSSSNSSFRFSSFSNLSCSYIKKWNTLQPIDSLSEHNLCSNDSVNIILHFDLIPLKIIQGLIPQLGLHHRIKERLSSVLEMYCIECFGDLVLGDFWVFSETLANKLVQYGLVVLHFVSQLINVYILI